MNEDIILSILKEFYPQGDDYFCGETDDYFWALYSNDYPMQHGIGIEIRCYKKSNKIRSYQNGYRYKLPEDKLNEILEKYKNS
jgi:hypothetical protein